MILLIFTTYCLMELEVNFPKLVRNYLNKLTFNTKWLVLLLKIISIMYVGLYIVRYMCSQVKSIPLYNTLDGVA